MHAARIYKEDMIHCHPKTELLTIFIHVATFIFYFYFFKKKKKKKKNKTTLSLHNYLITPKHIEWDGTHMWGPCMWISPHASWLWDSCARIIFQS
jgi:hypothetical protein